MEARREEQYGPWEDVMPEILALVFKKMSLREILSVVPVVCKSWRKATMQSDLWQEMDILHWCDDSKPERMDRMVRRLLFLTCGSMRKLSLWGLSNDSIFASIALSGNSLQTLRMPMSDVTDSITIQVAPNFATLTYLDISCCEKMTSCSLEALGKHCKFLTRLNRNMYPEKISDRRHPKDDEAFAIAQYMCGLKHIELGYGLFTDAGMEAILSKCKELEHLDIHGCWNVVMQDSLAKQCQKLKVFVGPVVDDSNVHFLDLSLAII